MTKETSSITLLHVSAFVAAKIKVKCVIVNNWLYFFLPLCHNTMLELVRLTENVSQ